MPPKNSKPNANELKDLLFFYQKKQFSNAEKLALSLTTKYPRHPFAWKIFAAVLEQTDRIAEALEINKKVIFLSNSDPEALLSLGNCFFRLGKLEDAELSYKKALLSKPNYIEALNNLGIILNKLKRYEESSSYYKKIINLRPNFIQAYNNISQNLFSVKKFDEAILYLKKLIDLKPDDYLAYNNLCSTLVQSGQFEEAILICQKSIDIKPDFEKSFFNLGNAHRELGQYQDAISNYRKAIEKKHDYVEAYNNLGITLTSIGQIEDAAKILKQAISFNPNHFESYNNLGMAVKILGRFEEANGYFQKAVDIKPDYADGYHNWGRALLLNFDFKKSFKLIEWRFKTKRGYQILAPLNTSKPRWDGLRRHKVFVWKEQGIGDHIMFSSMISELHASVEKVIVECDPRLITLFQRSFSDDIQFITDRTEINENDYDSHLPIGSLPLHFRKDLNDFKKSSQGWLQADPVRVQNIQKNIKKTEAQKIIGLSWKTKSSLRGSFARNIKLEDLLLPLKELNFIFVNLQYGDVSEEVSKLKANYGIDVLEISDLDLFNDIDGLAALISTCDCVISIDNLNPHLAGALNKSTQLLLPYAANERWGYKTKKSYWYDSITIYRQSVPGNWDDPILEVENNLKI